MGAELISAIASGASAIVNDVYKICSGERAYSASRDDTKFSKNLAKWNAYQQLKEFEYAKDIQSQIFEREDNAVQRRMADLEKAGLSKTLAAGSGAGAGSVVSTHLSNVGNPSSSAPNTSTTFQTNFLDLLKNLEEIGAVEEQINFAKAQRDKINAETKSVEIENEMKSYDFERVKKGYGMNKGHGVALDAYYLLNNWLQDNAVEPIANGIDKSVQGIKNGYNSYVQTVDEGLKKGKSFLQSFKDHFPKVYFEDGYLVIEEPTKKLFNKRK